MTTVVLSQDLLLLSQVLQSAAALNAQVETVCSLTDLLTRCQEGEVAQIVLDLSTPQLAPAQVLRALGQLEQPIPRLIAFGPHVHTARLEAARAAGCDVVITRGQFHRDLQKILQG